MLWVTIPGSVTVGFSSSTSREVPGILSPLPAHRRGTTSPQFRSETESKSPFSASRSRGFGPSASRSPLSREVKGPGIGMVSYRGLVRLALDTLTALASQFNNSARAYAVHFLETRSGVPPPLSPSPLSPHRTLPLEPEPEPRSLFLDPESAADFWQNPWPNVFKALAVLQWWFFNVLLILLNKWIYPGGCETP